MTAPAAWLSGRGRQSRTRSSATRPPPSGRASEPATVRARWSRAASEVPRPLVLDADALNVIARTRTAAEKLRARGRGGRAVILTPHPGEMARLLDSSSTAVQPIASVRCVPARRDFPAPPSCSKAPRRSSWRRPAVVQHWEIPAWRRLGWATCCRAFSPRYRRSSPTRSPSPASPCTRTASPRTCWRATRRPGLPRQRGRRRSTGRLCRDSRRMPRMTPELVAASACAPRCRGDRGGRRCLGGDSQPGNGGRFGRPARGRQDLLRARHGARLGIDPR